MSPNGVIVIDDVLPNHPLQASRERQSRVWIGDVWRIVSLLQRMRPDLHLTVFDTDPTGLLVVSNLDPNNRQLWDAYNPTVRDLVTNCPTPPDSVLARKMAVSPSQENLRVAMLR